MKKLEKKFKKQRNTIESFVGPGRCTCGCPCAYCAGTWSSQSNADADRVDYNNFWI